MSAPDIKLTRATPSQKETLARLFQLYLYDISLFAHWSIGDDGHYDFADRLLAPYWDAKDHHPYLVTPNDELAGFCLINRAQDNVQIWDMGQFFILRKFRGHGVAQTAFQRATTLHTGKWQICVLPANTPALKFWISSTTKLSNGTTTQDTVTYTVTYKVLTMTRLTFQTRA